MPFTPGLKQLWQKIFRKSDEGMLDAVVQRFIQVFQDHGVEVSQIPRLLPQIRLDDLKSPESLLAALTPELLDQTANLFGVRTAWLEGVDDQIYDCCHCYKHPERFFEHLAEVQHRVDYDFSRFSLRVLCSSKKLDYQNDREQLLVPILVEKIAELGEERIERFHIYRDGWDWSHWPSRIQLKAMARMIFKTLHSPVPLLVALPEDLQNILDGKKIPRKELGGCLISSPSLEDFALAKTESPIAMEIDEMPDVLKYIATHNLENLISALPFEEESPIEHTQPEPKQPPRNIEPPSKGKRHHNNKALWEPLEIAAKIIWAQDESLSIEDVIRRIKRMPQLPASKFTESAIRKHIAKLAPPGIQGKSGRKPKKPT